MKCENTCRQIYEAISKLCNGEQKAFYEWMLSSGVAFKGRTLTRVECERLQKEAPRKLFTPRMCFYQSQMIAIGLTFRYFEGQATPKTLGIPFEHAWLVDKEGQVWDATWKEGEEYFGVEIPRDYIIKNILATGEAQGLLAQYYGEVIVGKMQ